MTSDPYGIALFRSAGFRFEADEAPRPTVWARIRTAVFGVRVTASVGEPVEVGRRIGVR